MRLEALTFTVLCAVGAAGGCGDDGSGGMTAGEYVAQLSEVFCAKAFACEPSFPTNHGVTHEQLFGASAQACIADQPTSVQVQAAVDGGRVLYDAEAAAECLTALGAQACAAFWDSIFGGATIASCDAAFTGTVANGSACTIDLECASLFCDNRTCATPP